MTDYTTVSARAMLVTLTMSSWSARKLDKAVSRAPRRSCSRSSLLL